MLTFEINTFSSNIHNNFVKKWNLKNPYIKWFLKLSVAQAWKILKKKLPDFLYMFQVGSQKYIGMFRIFLIFVSFISQIWLMHLWMIAMLDPSNDLFASFFKSMDRSLYCICWMVSMKDLKFSSTLNPQDF